MKKNFFLSITHAIIEEKEMIYDVHKNTENEM